jgi:RsiW-degrading membrane proteinase PrsW (M82 family)
MHTMSISASCPAQSFTIRQPDVEDAAAALLEAGEPAETGPADAEPEPTYELAQPAPTRPVPRRRVPDVATLPPLTTNDPPPWLRHLHWLLALALIPMIVSLSSSSSDDDDSIPARIEQTLEKATPAERQRVLSILSDHTSLDELINALPDHRVLGAAFARSTRAHWGLAAAATVLFMAFMMFLASDGSAQPVHVLVVGLVTATLGVGFLFLVQILAAWTRGYVFIGRSIVALLFYVFKFIDFSYDAASDPDNGFILSFLGFTMGVGLCEELVKAIPLFWHRNEEGGSTWRGLFIWGLASGAGFGIAEGILYSSRYYNGIAGPGMYAVRFLSCVALHAIWSGSVAITLYLKRDMFNHIDTWHEWIGPVLFVIGLPMILHGLFDTCLKKDLNAAALVVALVSFGYLAFLNSRLRGTDDEDARREMLREYKRRRAAMS